MAEQSRDDDIVFVNLLREERGIDETSVIQRSLRDVERWISSSAIYDTINSGLSKAMGVERVPMGNAAMHETVSDFRQTLKPGECGVIAHGNSYSIVDNRIATSPEHSRMTALGIENILKNAGCTPDMPVILYSCNTGTGNNSLASELSQYHSTVVAPDGVIAEFALSTKPGIYKGDETTGNIDWDAPRSWRVFSHGSEIASYDWGEDVSQRALDLQQDAPER